MTSSTLPVVIPSLLLLLLACITPTRSLYTFTPHPHASASSIRQPLVAGRHVTLSLSSHHSVTPRPSSSSFHPLSRFSTYQLTDGNTTGCSSVDFSALIDIDGQGPFRLIVDSGSTTLAVASSSCVNCSGVTPTYRPTSSNIAYGSRSIYSYYGSGSGWSGHAYTASVALSGSSTCSMTIATIEINNGFINSDSCLLNVQTSIANYSQGIIGFAYPSIAVAGTNSWITNYVAATSVANEFSIQMCTGGGNLWVGDYDPNFLSAPFTYIPIVQTNYYSVMLTTIDVYTQSLTQPGTISGTAVLSLSQSVLGPCTTPSNYDCAKVDSGTTQIVLPSTAYSALVSAITNDPYYQSVFNSRGIPGIDVLSSGGDCTPANTTGMPSLTALQTYLPKVGFTFLTGPNGNRIGPLILTSIPGYLTISYDSTGLPYYCGGLANGGSSYPLLGYAFMNQWTVRHDLAGQRLGFGKTAQCGVASPPLVSYEWVVGGWGGCGASCGTGMEWRQVNCTDMYGVTQPDIRCAVVYLAARPADSRPCNTQQCGVNAVTTFTSLSISATSIQAGQAQVVQVSYTYTGATPDYVSLYLSPASNSSSLLPFYISPNASKGTSGAGTYQWTVPSSTPNGTYLLGVYASGTSSNQSYFASQGVNITGCTGSMCGVGLCNTTGTACNGRGECQVSGGVATCSPCLGGYNGSLCQVAPSNGVCTLRCLNSGTVTGTCTCACPASYTGVLCERIYSNLTLTLSQSSSALNESTSASSTLASTVTTDVTYALGLGPSDMEVISVQVVNASTMSVEFLLLTSGSVSVLQSWFNQLTSQVGSGQSSPLTLGLATSTASNVVITPTTSITPITTESSTAGTTTTSPATSTPLLNSTSTDPSTDVLSTGVGLMVYTVAAVAGGLFVLGLVWWCLSRLCRKGKGQVAVSSAGMGKHGGTLGGGLRGPSASADSGSGGGSGLALSRVHVSPEASAPTRIGKRGLHTPSYDYGY